MKRKQLARIDLSNPDIPKVSFVNVEALRSDLRDFKDSERVYVTIERYYRKRTLAQNSLFHVYCQAIADETGQDMEDVKSTVKLLYARKPVLDKDGEPIVNKDTGEILEYVQDTRDMNTVEMMNLCDKTQMFALDYFGIILENPDEQVELKFKNIE